MEVECHAFITTALDERKSSVLRIGSIPDRKNWILDKYGPHRTPYSRGDALSRLESSALGLFCRGHRRRQLCDRLPCIKLGTKTKKRHCVYARGT